METNTNIIKMKTDSIELTANNINNSTTFYQEETNRQIYEMFIQGKFNKKEGNKMIESMNLIDLYANKHIENINKNTEEKIKKIKEKNNDVINRFNELKEKFHKDLEELYLSQFTEEQKKELILNGAGLFTKDKQLIKDKAFIYGYYVNNEFRTDEYYDVLEERNNDVAEINDLIKIVKAHVSIAKTKEEVEEILIRYGIIDKKRKLVTE